MKHFALVHLGLILLLAGSARAEPAATEAPKPHVHIAPHGGTLVKLGKRQFNLELLFDETRGVLHAWVLGPHAEDFVRIELPGFEAEARDGSTVHTLKFAAIGNEASGETVGDTSEFEAEAAWLRAAKAFDGKLKEITVKGNRYTDIDFSYPKNDKGKQQHDHEHEDPGHK